MKDFFFPYKKMRNIQEDMLKKVYYAIKKKKRILIHAPTGLGKTAASLSPALKYAFDKDLTIFFLTSRHTQHIIAIDTLKEIKEKYDLDFTVTDVIGKRWMCVQPGIENLYSSEFNEYCKAIREDGKCEFYNNTKKKGKLTIESQKTLDELKTGIYHSEELIKVCERNDLCAYEIAVLLAKKSKVIVTDYNYLFNPGIRNAFLLKIGKELENSIVIIDEGHNLGNRVKDFMTVRLTNNMIKRAIKEAKKFQFNETISNLSYIQDLLNDLSSNLNGEQEKLIKKEQVINFLNKIKDYDELIAELQFTGDEIRERQRQSYVGSIGLFLDAWQGTDDGFARILYFNDQLTQPLISLSYRCLDPSPVIKEVTGDSYSTILMSGTLTPTSMYKDLFGFFEDSLEAEFKNPFPEKNRLNLIIPKTTTKFTQRNEKQYEEIAKICSEVVEEVKGNTIIFFPSYQLRDSIFFFFKKNKNRKFILEKPGLTKEQKKKIIEEFKRHKDKGAVLLAVTSGNFGEGIDLPGDLLKAVVVVGIPLTKPDLETNQLIKYYDRKFGRGVEYGYILPTITKVMQNAGRCIRSETDKGVIIFLDERYILPTYRKCFPSDWDIKVSLDYKKEIINFLK